MPTSLLTAEKHQQGMQQMVGFAPARMWPQPWLQEQLEKCPCSSAELSVPATAEGDAAACIICLEPLTAEGEHRVVALKCGHLFGKSCIEVWVRQKKLCPQCKAR